MTFLCLFVFLRCGLLVPAAYDLLSGNDPGLDMLLTNLMHDNRRYGPSLPQKDCLGYPLALRCPERYQKIWLTNISLRLLSRAWDRLTIERDKKVVLSSLNHRSEFVHPVGSAHRFRACHSNGPNCAEKFGSERWPLWAVKWLRNGYFDVSP